MTLSFHGNLQSVSEHDCERAQVETLDRLPNVCMLPQHFLNLGCDNALGMQSKSDAAEQKMLNS